MRLRKVGLAIALSAPSAACFWGTSTVRGECNVNSDCKESSVACQETHCVDHRCVTSNTPEGIATTTGGLEADCHRFVCDGNGKAVPQIDVTAIPRRAPPPCKNWRCTTDGVADIVNAPAGVQPDMFKDCERTLCDGNGNATMEPDPSDVPSSASGDCKKSSCSPDGTVLQIPDDTDVPQATTTCTMGSCSNGVPGKTPRNVGMVCDATGFVCSSTGNCNVCFTPDSACTDLGPTAAAHSAGTPYDWRGVGRCDDDGREWCGSVRAGETVAFTYHDDQTGALCEFDPRFTFNPTGPAKMCLLAQCPVGPGCPSGWTSVTDGNFRGCCGTVGPGAMSARIDYCRAANVKITVTTTDPCIGYRLEFNQ
jgi:hypothetical protein